MTLALHLWLWLVATAGHFALTARWADRLGIGATASIDQRFFAIVLGGVGTLSLVLHGVAVLAGLSLTGGLVGLAAWHAGVALALRGERGTAGPPLVRSMPRLAGMEVLAAAWLAGMTITWLLHAPETAVVAGTDAAHYHVPVAVNLALGASPFDLPATPHLYPMAGSTIGAWFIVPTGDALIVDLAMCLPFLLLAVSLNAAFRAAAGASGLAWATWITAALFATPIFRVSALVSADLWFAASFVATLAVMADARAARRWDRPRLVLLALALGLLVGSKTTGALAAVLLVGVFAIVTLPAAIRARAWRSTDRWPTRVAAATGLAVLALGAGGVWLVRNWIGFGSPLAPTGVSLFGVQVFPGEPWQATSYLSVLGDLQRDPDFTLTSRTTHFVDRWLGPWFLWVLLPGLIVPIDLAVAAWRRSNHPPYPARLVAVALTIGAGVPLIWMLVGAPWTSLEWTRGLALRYALPIGALLPWLSLLALFPMAWRRPEPPGRAAMAFNVAVMAGALLLFRGSLDPAAPGYVPVPGFATSAGIAGLAIALLVVRPGLWSTRRGAVALVVLAAAAAGFWSASAARGSENAVREAEDVVASGAPAQSPVGAIYGAVLAVERDAGRGCDTRRFFALTRLDEPLRLQSARYRNLVFYAGRDVHSAGRAAPLGPCDYVVSTRAVMGTDKGLALAAALSGGAPVQEIADTGRFVLLRTGR